MERVRRCLEIVIVLVALLLGYLYLASCYMVLFLWDRVWDPYETFFFNELGRLCSRLLS